MDLNQDNSPKDRQGGGRKAAALLYLAFAATAVLSIALTHLSTGSRDRLIQFVPSDAVFYLHAQGRENVTRISETVPFIPENKANELGLFALNLDEGQVWTAALLWSRLSPPSEKELSELADAGALRVAPTFYIIRTGEGPIILSEGKGGSLNDQREAARALATMRSVSRTQAYLDPDSLLEGGLDSDLFPVNLDSAVMAVPWVSGRPTMLVSGMTKAAGYPRVLGFRLPDSALGQAAPSLLNDRGGEPSLSLALRETNFDTTSTLFSEIDRSRREAGVPEHEELDQARDNVKKLLSGPLSVVIHPIDDGQSSPEFIAYLPGVQPSALKAAMSDLMNTSIPRAGEYSLPDGRTTTEYIIEPGMFSYPVEDGGPSLPRNTLDGETWPAYPIIGFGSGSAIASDMSLLEDIQFSGAICLSSKWPTIAIKDVPRLPAGKGVLNSILELINLKDIVIHRIGDNLLFFCG
jgi:hypothetical protein